MKDQEMKPIAILGAGSWGTALALYLSRRGQRVHLWSIELSEVTAMIAEKKNSRYLPQHDFPDSLCPFIEIKEALHDVQDILLAVPSVGFKSTLKSLKPLIHPHQHRFICATKGLDQQTGDLPNQMMEDELGDQFAFAVLSGPSFAKEVAAGQPTAVMIASSHTDFLQDLVDRFNSDIFHVTRTQDVVGVEVGSVVKNVIAVATGISDGLGYGVNARSALMTHGFAELKRLGKAMGGRDETLTGLSGLGDLILTCSDDQSRNRRFGLAIGQGKTATEAEHIVGQVVEGKRNAALVIKLSERLKIEMPICHVVWAILQAQMTPHQAIQTMLSAHSN